MEQPRSIEVSAADIELAIAKGVADLGVSRDEVMVEVLEEPGRRLLGLGSRQAKVRLTVIRAPATPPVPEMPRPTSQGIPAPVVPIITEPELPRRASPAPKRAEKEKRLDFEEEAIPVLAPEASPVDLAEEARVGKDVLNIILNHMGFPGAQINAQPAQTDGNEPQHWTLEIHGQDLGVLIGRRGETLAAIQYVTRLITSRELGRRANLVVDVEGYKSRREAMLQRLAQRMAEQAVQRGRTVSMEPMPPHERRIIHVTLRDHPDVTTESVGEGEHRKVTVVPRRPK